jgi:hypothetical protein
MKKQSFISKLFVSVTISSGAIWFGSYISKLFTIYNLFEPKDLALKASFESESIGYLLAELLPVFVTPFTAYIVMIVFFLLAVSVSKVNIKKEGWLFISIMLVLITLPFEIYLMLIDYRVISSLLSNSYNNEYILELLRDRITSLSGFPIILLLCYLSIIFLIVFKPLAAKVNLINEN